MNARVDDAIQVTVGAGIEAIFESLAERLSKRHLHGQHDRVAQHDHPSLARCLRPNLRIVAHARPVDGDVGLEFGGGKARPRTRPQPVADRRVGHEQFLETGLGFRSAPQAQARLEQQELRDHDDQKEDGPFGERADAWRGDRRVGVLRRLASNGVRRFVSCARRRRTPQFTVSSLGSRRVDRPTSERLLRHVRQHRAVGRWRTARRTPAAAASRSCRARSSLMTRDSARDRSSTRLTPAIAPASTKGERLVGRPTTRDGTPIAIASIAAVELAVTTTSATAVSRARSACGGAMKTHDRVRSVTNVRFGAFRRMWFHHDPDVRHLGHGVDQCAEPASKLTVLRGDEDDACRSSRHRRRAGWPRDLQA